MPNWYTSKITNKMDWADGLFTLRIDARGVQPYDPGQFLHLAIQQPDGHVINRPYSVASPYGDEIEFFIVEVADGKLTPQFRHVNVGDEILVSENAAGSFTLAKTPSAKCIWLIATGTGIAPYIAMLRDKEIWQRYQKIVLVHGTRYVRDLGYREELCALRESRADQFTYLPAITREEHKCALNGRLTTLLQDRSLEKAAKCEIAHDTTAIMLCGNPDMLNEMEQQLIDRNLKKHRSKAPGNIVAERYW